MKVQIIVSSIPGSLNIWIVHNFEFFTNVFHMNRNVKYIKVNDLLFFLKRIFIYLII